MVFILMALFSGALFAEDETLFSGKISHGGYGGPEIRTTVVNGEYGALVGGRAAYIINRSYSLGIAGYGLVNNIKADAPYDTSYIHFGYGGLLLGYEMRPDKLVHLSFNTLVGAGGATLGDKFEDSDRDNDEDWDRDRWEDKGDVFFVLEPSLNLTLNMTKFFRIDLGGSYRYITGINLAGVKADELSGPSINLTLRFGFF